MGSIFDPVCVTLAMTGIDSVFHTATLHKPHVVTLSKQQFIDTNITGTNVLLQEAVKQRVDRFVFTSTTSVFGKAMQPGKDTPAVWVTEQLNPIPKNIYGAKKLAAEALRSLVHHEHGLNCLILRTSRFFPEDDDSATVRLDFTSDNSKANEFLFRRVELEDVLSAHLLAASRA
ncbi:MAG: UDP-glucose 4-epimerase [Pseudohongiellaceae bacterium]